MAYAGLKVNKIFYSSNTVYISIFLSQSQGISNTKEGRAYKMDGNMSVEAHS